MYHEGHLAAPPECHCGWDTAVNLSPSLPLTLSATTLPSGVESFLPKSPSSKGSGGEKPSQEVDFDLSWPRPGRLCTRLVVIYNALSLPSGNPALTHEGLIQLGKKKKKAKIAASRHDWVLCLRCEILHVNQTVFAGTFIT